MVTVINTVDTGHEDMIHDAEVDYYGLRLATCSSDNSVKVYDIKNGASTLIDDLKGHFGPVWQIAWSHPKFGNLLASCSYDRKVIIWKEQQRKWSKYYEYANHDSSVNSVQFAPAEFGLILACGSSDGTISVLTYNQGTNTWDAKKIQNAHSIGCNAVSWAPAITPIFGNDNNQATTPVKRLASGGCDNLVKIWKEDGDSSSVKFQESLVNTGIKQLIIQDVAKASQENHITIIYNKCRFGTYKPFFSTLLNFSVLEANRKAKPVLPGVSYTLQFAGRWVEETKLEVHSDWVRDVAWAPSIGLNRYTLASCSQDKRVVIWNSNDCINWTSTVLHTFDDVVWNVSWSLNGNILAVSGGDNKVTLWDQNTEGVWQCISDVQKGQGQINN